MKCPGVAFNLCVISVTGGKQKFVYSSINYTEFAFNSFPDKFIRIWILQRIIGRSDTIYSESIGKKLYSKRSTCTYIVLPRNP